MSIFSTRQRGFTFVEVLVAVAIVAILASVALASLQGMRQKSHDTARKSDMTELQLALRLYRDSNGRFPSSADGNCTHDTSFLAGGCLEVLVTDGLLPELPTDPDSSRQYHYDNWCRTPLSAVSDKQYRVWADGDLNNNGVANGWWSDNNIGATTCTDPS